MIGTLHDLFAQIVAKLLHGRLQRQNGAAKPRDSVPISVLMAEHIARAEEEPDRQEGRSDEEVPASSVPATGGFANTRPLKGDSESVSPGFFSALSQRFARHRSQAKLEPFMAEKMRVNTLDHVNKSLSFARLGNAEGARIHARLAETALETAGDYMSDDEYHQLRERVEDRLRSASTDSAPP